MLDSTGDSFMLQLSDSVDLDCLRHHDDHVSGNGRIPSGAIQNRAISATTTFLFEIELD